MSIMAFNPNSDNSSAQKNSTASDNCSTQISLPSPEVMEDISRYHSSGIVRQDRKNHNFVIIDKVPLEDNRLSFRARGILAFLLSKRNDWVVNMKHLENCAGVKEGREAVRNAVKELEQVGYLIRVKSRNERGQLCGYTTLVFETLDDRNDYLKQRAEQAELEQVKAAVERSNPYRARVKPEDGKPDIGSAGCGQTRSIVINEVTVIKERKTIKENTQERLTALCVSPSGFDDVDLENAEEPTDVNANQRDPKEEELTTKEVDNVTPHHPVEVLPNGSNLSQDVAENTKSEYNTINSAEVKIKPSESIFEEQADPVIQDTSLAQEQAEISLSVNTSSSLDQSSATVTALYTSKPCKRQEGKQRKSAGNRKEWNPKPEYSHLKGDFMNWRAIALHKAKKVASVVPEGVRMAENWANKDHKRADAYFADFLAETAERDRIAAIDDPHDHQLIEEMKQRATGKLGRWLLEYDIPYDVLLTVAEVFNGGKGENSSEFLLAEWIEEQEAIAAQQSQQPVNYDQDATENDNRDQLPETVTATEQQVRQLEQQYQLEQPVIIDINFDGLTWQCPDPDLRTEFIYYLADCWHGELTPDICQKVILGINERQNNKPGIVNTLFSSWKRSRDAKPAIATMSEEETLLEQIMKKATWHLRQELRITPLTLESLRAIHGVFEETDNTVAASKTILDVIRATKS